MNLIRVLLGKIFFLLMLHPYVLVRMAGSDAGSPPRAGSVLVRAGSDAGPPGAWKRWFKWGRLRDVLQQP